MADIETIALGTRYFTEVAAPSTPASGTAVIYTKTDGKLYLKDDAGTETDLTSGGGASAIDDLSDVDTDKSKTPADGDVLTFDGTDWNAEAASGGSSLSTGSTFPGGPSTGERYRRSDLDYMVFFYDGTRWLTETRHTFSASTFDTAATTYRGGIGFDEAGLDVYVEDIDVAAAVQTTHNSSNRYDIRLDTITADGSGGTVTASIATVDTNVLCPGTNNFTGSVTAVDAVVDVSATPALGLITYKTGSPGNIRMWATIHFRYIAT